MKLTQSIRSAFVRAAMIYPTWVDRRRMSKEQADRELGRMRAVLATLQRIKEAMTKPDPMSQALNEGTGTYRP